MERDQQQDQADIRALLLTESDRRLSSADSAQDSAMLRSGVVIAAALVIAGLHTGPDIRHWAPLVGVGLALTAALLSVLPRRLPAVPIASLTKKMPTTTFDQMAQEVLLQKVKAVRWSENAYNSRNRQLLLSYASLALALVGVVYANL